jgi:DNA-binding NarL/FixJ family response regulator
MAMSADEAVALALDDKESGESANADDNVDDNVDDTGEGRRANGTPTGQGRRANETFVAVTPPSTLTPREREIAALIVRGLTNRAIAGELFISTATAARHVANIMAKLGFQSRTQIAAWMVENDRARPG